MSAQVIGKHFGCECKYYPTVMDGPVVRWNWGDLEVSASRNGVMLQGNSPAMARDTLGTFKQLLQLAGQAAAWLATPGGDKVALQMLRNGEGDGR